jgi:dihydrofolate reductase
MSKRIIGLIVSHSENYVIGKNNEIPWRGKYPEDLKRFKCITEGCTIIMGRNTWESIGRRPLPKRKNIVITSHDLNNTVETYKSIPKALEAHRNSDIWFIGGFKIYVEALNYVNVIDITLIPEYISENDCGLVFLPNIVTHSPEWVCESFNNPDDTRISHYRATHTKK